MLEQVAKDHSVFKARYTAMLACLSAEQSTVLGAVGRLIMRFMQHLVQVLGLQGSASSVCMCSSLSGTKTCS